MRKAALLTVFMLLSLMASVCGAQEVATGFINKTLPEAKAMARYVVYVPYDYTPEKAWPMIVFLHGAGERGKDGLVQTAVGLGPALLRRPDWFPAIVVMPQCPKESFWDVILEDMEAAMAQTQADYTIDAKRIYLTGLSMGGYGTWCWGAMKSDTFAALMPICGGGTPSDMNPYCKAPIPEVFGTLMERVEALKGMPIWALHGASDGVVPPLRSKQMVKLIEKAGGNVQYTEYPETGHNSWDKAYAEEKAIRWLFEQKKESKTQAAMGMVLGEFYSAKSTSTWLCCEAPFEKSQCMGESTDDYAKGAMAPPEAPYFVTAW